MQLVDTEGLEVDMVKISPNMAQLERLSLERRPEIREEWYRKRLNQKDIDIAKAQLWPNVSISAGVQYDSNQYLYNNNWSQTGVNVSLNLLKLLQLPSLNATAENQAATDDMRRIALSMAILTQVRVGALRYELARQEVVFADQSLRVDRSLLDYAVAAKSTAFGSELEVIRAEGRFLLARYQREAAYSRAQAAWGRLYNSIGLDVMPEAIDNQDVATLAVSIRNTVNVQEVGNLLSVPDAATPIEVKKP
jgi:outer membrane protein